MAIPEHKHQFTDLVELKIPLHAYKLTQGNVVQQGSITATDTIKQRKCSVKGCKVVETYDLERRKA